ncbi:MAG: hypothetical protein MJZ33_02655 [Paludibacteraceae bacterium]|nr:hypothetical protein [Paludibacteraceae bacterium]
MYVPITPSFLGVRHCESVDVQPILPYIEWTYFFHAWRVTGNFKGIERMCNCESCRQQFLSRFPLADHEKASAAWRLFHDAREMLGRLVTENRLKLSSALCFWEARSDDEAILFFDEGKEVLRLPMLRQQHPSEREEYCFSLSDFVSPKKDYVGLFCVSVAGAQALSDEYRKAGDDYSSILVESVSDRLVEAYSEWLHRQVRQHIWGYAPEENLSMEEVRKGRYQGIRPAIGYPSMPDQSLIFDVGRILHLDKIGVELTENGAMRPNSSICGLYISHPQSNYFMVGKIGEDQLAEYAMKRGKTVDEMRRWLSCVL